MRPTGLKLSRYNTYMSRGLDRVAIFNCLSRACVVLEKDEWRRVKALHRGGAGVGTAAAETFLRSLVDFQMLCERELDELRCFETVHQMSRFSDRGMTLTVAPTLSCNLRCDYCFQRHSDRHGAMKPEVVDRVASWVEAALPRLSRLSVAWYGGEPTLAWTPVSELSRRLLKSCGDHHVAYGGFLVTNGVRVSRRILDDIDALHIGAIQVTLDGPPEIHDTRRIGADRRPTFASIVKNIRRFRENTQAEVHIRVNVDRRNVAGIRSLLVLLAREGLPSLGKCSVYFAPVDDCSLETHDIRRHLLERKEYFDREAELYQQAAGLALSCERYPVGMSRGNCAAICKHGWVVLPNGDLHRCWNEVSYPERRVGSLMSRGDLGPARRNLRDWLLWRFREKCRQCKLLPLCVGGCPMKDVRSSDFAGGEDRTCPSYRFTLRSELGRYIEARAPQLAERLAHAEGDGSP